MSATHERVAMPDTIYRRGGPKTYYHYQSLKPPRWGWEIYTYFFLGGVAAGSYLVATLTAIFGTGKDHSVGRAGRYVALASVALCPLLLVKDLGRPERFTHMLRIIKSRSPLNLGTYGLSGLAFFTALASLRQAVEDGIVDRGSPIGRMLYWFPPQVLGVIGTLFAFFVSSYTGVLTSFTNVPLWAKNYLLQGPLFLTSALSTGVAAVTLAMQGMKDVSPGTRDWLEKTESRATLGELGLLLGSLVALRGRARPLLRQPFLVPFWLGYVGLGLIFPIVLRSQRGRAKPAVRAQRTVIASIAILVGGFIFRAVMVLAGRAETKDPAEYFAYTAAERPGG
ncbi:MAG: NrfD/PsrC family molybdoenzyme membrane anchor subunit [Chloroflexota bacterium]